LNTKSSKPPKGAGKNAGDPLLFTFFNEVGIIEQLARNRFERVMPDGMRMAHFTMLNHMVRLGDGWTPARLASAFQLTKGAITNTLQRLQARGLVRVRPDPDDGRSKRVFLTPAGRRMRERCIAALAPELARVQAELGRDAIAAALPGLQAVRAYLDNARE